MTPLLPTKTLGTVRRRFCRCAALSSHYQAAGGAVVVLAMASGFGLGFAAVVEHLTTVSTEDVTVAEVSEPRFGEQASADADRWFDAPTGATAPGLPLAEQSAVFYDEEDGAACDRAPCRRIRRWLPTTDGS